MRPEDRILPAQVFDRLVFRVIAVGIERLQASAKVIEEPEVRTALAWRVDHPVVPLNEPMSVGEGTLLLTCQRGWHQEDLRLDLVRPDFATLNLRRPVPVRGRLVLEALTDHHPVEVWQPFADEGAVVAPHDRVLAYQQQAANQAVPTGQHHPELRVVADYLRQPLVTPLVVRAGPLTVPRAQQADGVLREVGPPASRDLLGLEVVLESPMRSLGARLRQVARQQVVQSGDVCAALNARVAAQGEDTAARPPDVAQQSLDDGAGADHLNPSRVMGPAHRVAPGRRPLAARVVRDRLRDLQEGLHWTASYPLDHLGRVRRVVPAGDLVDAVGLLE